MPGSSSQESIACAERSFVATAPRRAEASCRFRVAQKQELRRLSEGHEVRTKRLSDVEHLESQPRAVEASTWAEICKWHRLASHSSRCTGANRYIEFQSTIRRF